MADVFDALANAHRRRLLDVLRERDGRTLGELEGCLPLSRFAVMKHLGVLEDAGLVVTRKVGREKFHYLNPVPIQDVSDRWISRYASPFARGLSDLKSGFQQGIFKMNTVTVVPKHVFELFIDAAPEAVWAVLTDDDKTPLWQHFNMTSRTDWRVGGKIQFLIGEQTMIVGELIELTPPKRLSHSFAARWAEDVAGDPPSRVTWELEPAGQGATKVTLVHDDFGGETTTSRMVATGWVEAISRLKTLVETGRPFDMPVQRGA
ncbi:MAG: arsR [Proteobacteria bacterium]|nr:arsR [Pseudomonadota bacterium]